MSDLTKVSSSNSNEELVMMSSKEITEVYNSVLKKEDASRKEHNKVLRDIRNMLKELEPEKDTPFSTSYEVVKRQTLQGEETQEILLNKKLTLCLISGWSATARMKMIERIEELENAQPKAPALPRTYAEALLEAGRLALALEQETAEKELALQEGQEKQLVIEAQEPMVEKWHEFIDNDGCMLTTDFVKSQGVSSAAKFNAYLIKRGILCTKTKPNKPHTPRADYEEWFRRLAIGYYTDPHTGERRVSYQLQISALGMDKLREVVAEGVAEGDLKLAKVK